MMTRRGLFGCLVAAVAARFAPKVLSGDQQAFVEAMLNPEAPNERLRTLANDPYWKNLERGRAAMERSASEAGVRRVGSVEVYRLADGYGLTLAESRLRLLMSEPLFAPIDQVVTEAALERLKQKIEARDRFMERRYELRELTHLLDGFTDEEKMALYWERHQIETSWMRRVPQRYQRADDL